MDRMYLVTTAAFLLRGAQIPHLARQMLTRRAVGAG